MRCILLGNYHVVLSTQEKSFWRVSFEETIATNPWQEKVMQAMSADRAPLCMKVGADLTREDTSTVEFCQLITFDHSRCCYFLISVFLVIQEQMSVEEQSEPLYTHLNLSPTA